MATDDKKGGKRGAGAGFIDSDFANTVKDSAQQIWLAGLGAFAKAQAEGGKVFDTLVKDGINLQKKTQAAAEEKMDEARSAGTKWSEMASEFQSKAGQQWDKLEGLFEERTARAMKRLRVPSADDIAALSERIDALSAEVAKLSAATSKAKTQGAKAAAKSGKPAAARKTSLKPPASRKKA